MNVETGIALAASVIAIVSSIITPSIIVGKYLGTILTTQAAHQQAHARHDESARDQGRRLEKLGNDFSELRGEVRGREYSQAHRT